MSRKKSQINQTSEKDTQSSRLKAAGYVRLPPLWVSQEDMDMIAWMASKHSEAVSQIRSQWHKDYPDG